MYLSKHKNDFYYIYYKKQDGKRTKVATRTKFKSEALKFLSRFEKNLAQQVKLDFTKITLKDFAFQYLKHSESIHSPKTTRDYNQTFIFVQRYFGSLTIDTLTTKLMNNYIQHRIETSSIYQGRKDLINLKSAFNFAKKNNYLLNNPCDSIRRIKTPEKQPLYFLGAEFKRFLLSIDNNDFKDLVMLAVNTGLRQMELLTLTKEQIDLTAGILTLDNRVHLTKSKRIRVVPLNGIAKEVLNRRITFDTIFSFTSDQTIKLMKKYRTESGIRQELTFHSLRHTFASWLVQKGVPILNVSKLLGHSDIKTTQIYAHVSNNELRSSVEMLM
jgi:integrase